MTLRLEMFPAPKLWMNKAAARKAAAADLITECIPVVETVWGPELPPAAMAQARKLVGVGVREAIKFLTLSGSKAGEYWGCPLMQRYGIAHYWEPPVASVPEPSLPPEALKAYRWAAALVAGCVRNQLEDLHAAYTSDANMPALNRGLRNATYSRILQNEAWAYELAQNPWLLLQLSKHIPDIFIPAVAG